MEHCVLTNQAKECDDLEDDLVDNTMNTITGHCTVLAFFTSIVVFVLCLLAACKGNLTNSFIIGLVFVIAACLGMASGIAFTIDFKHYKNEKIKDHSSYLIITDFEYGWAYTLNWFGTDVALLSATLSFFFAYADRITVPRGAERIY